MKQFKTEQYDGLPPLGCCLYHKDIQPREENFLDMLRFTFVPYFELYSFTFFWLITIAFVYIVSLYMQNSNADDEFLRVSQKALFDLGQNYPYYIVRKFHYYRLITSIVLIRNLYHFIMAAIGILIFGSYVEALQGFKRIFLLSVTSGVGGELIRNAFVFSASIESLTPICGLIGYLMGLFLANRDTKWRYSDNEKVHMILIILLVGMTYLQLGLNYGNISLFSMGAGLSIGFSFFFCDPDSERLSKYRIPAIIFLVASIGVSTVYFMLKTQPQLLYIR